MFSDGRGMRADKIVSGSRTKLYRCDGATWEVGGLKTPTSGCPSLVRACKSAAGEWKATQAFFNHTNCKGGSKKPSATSAKAESSIIVNSNSKVSALALVKTMEGTIGDEMAQHTANRVKNLVLAKTAKSIGDGYARLQDYLDTLAEESGGTVVDVEVRYLCSVSTYIVYIHTYVPTRYYLHFVRCNMHVYMLLIVSFSRIIHIILCSLYHVHARHPIRVRTHLVLILVLLLHGISLLPLLIAAFVFFGVWLLTHRR